VSRTATGLLPSPCLTLSVRTYSIRNDWNHSNKSLNLETRKQQSRIHFSRFVLIVHCTAIQKRRVNSVFSPAQYVFSSTCSPSQDRAPGTVCPTRSVAAHRWPSSNALWKLTFILSAFINIVSLLLDRAPSSKIL